MNTNYANIIATAKENGGLLDAMLACQARDGYLSVSAIEYLACEFGAFPGQIYDTASFYSMITIAPAAKVDIKVCRGAPCHVAGAAEVIAAIEKVLDIKIGGITPDGAYSFGYTECIGQCQGSPSVLVNGKLYTEMSPEKIVELFGKGGLHS